MKFIIKLIDLMETAEVRISISIEDYKLKLINLLEIHFPNVSIKDLEDSKYTHDEEFNKKYIFLCDKESAFKNINFLNSNKPIKVFILYNTLIENEEIISLNYKDINLLKNTESEILQCLNKELELYKDKETLNINQISKFKYNGNNNIDMETIPLVIISENNGKCCSLERIRNCFRENCRRFCDNCCFFFYISSNITLKI